MVHNSEKHHRQSIRLDEYDYSQSGAYFLTICTEGSIPIFGTIENGEMFLNDFGKIAYCQWQKIPERFAIVELDVFQIMPTHMHGIVFIHDHAVPVGAGLAPALKGRPQGSPLQKNDGKHKVAPYGRRDCGGI